MELSEKSNRADASNEKLPLADTGNASNPTPHDPETMPSSGQQLLDKKAEKYLSESGNIEDYPDPQEELDAEKIEEEGKND
jgi:hypothetical protein